MKFIRDIISEKANMAGRAGRGETEEKVAVDDFRETIAEPALAEPTMTDDFSLGANDADVDIIHKVASGGQSLKGASNLAYAADESEAAPAEPESGVAVDHDTADALDAPVSNRRDQDTLSGRPPADLLDDEAIDDASELFGDLWADPVEDTEVEATKSFSAPEADQPTDQHPTPEAAAPEATLTVDTAVRQATQPVPEEASPFQRIMQRSQHMPPESPPRQAEPASGLHGGLHGDAQDETSGEKAPGMPVEMPKPIKMPAPAAGRAGRQAGRVKTRLLGFNSAQDSAPDPFDNRQSHELATASMYPVGWMVVTDGPGRGNAFTLFAGVSQIGRGEGQAIRLDFGDNSISRSNHAAIAYDGEQQSFFLGHGGKANLVRLNGNPVLSTEKLSSGAEIRIGETTLRFAALCGNDFDWGSCQEDDVQNAQFG